MRAAAYLDSAATMANDDESAIYACRAGNLYMDMDHYNNAIREYQIAWDQARDVRLRFYSKYYLARAEKLEKHYKSALEDVARLRGDDKFFQYLPLLEYQRAAVLYDSGEVSTAVQTFQRIDTVYATNEAATRSAFRLGNIYLHSVGDYQTALKYYQRCSSHPAVTGVSDRGREMATAIQDFFIRGYRAALTDSLYDHEAEVLAKSDSVTENQRANLDSLYEHAAEARRQLAGYYMFKLQIPDSAVVSYKIIANKFPKSRVYPSALYTLGEYYLASGDTADGRQYLSELIKEHPESEFAASASQLLGLPTPPAKIDSSQTDYIDAMQLVNRGKDDSALATLRVLVSDRSSKVRPQALYTIGWIYENKMGESDSAFVYYKKLEMDYPSTDFAEHVKPALTGYEQAQFDSAAARQREEQLARRDSLAKSSASAAGKGNQPKTVAAKQKSQTNVSGKKSQPEPDSLTIIERRRELLEEQDSTEKALGRRLHHPNQEDAVQRLKGLPIDSLEQTNTEKNTVKRTGQTGDEINDVLKPKNLPKDSTENHGSTAADSTIH